MNRCDKSLFCVVESEYDSFAWINIVYCVVNLDMIYEWI